MSDVSLLTSGNTTLERTRTTQYGFIKSPQSVIHCFIQCSSEGVIEVTVKKLDSVLTFNDDIIIKQLRSVIRGKLSNNN